MRKLIVFVLSLMAISCTADEDAVRILQSQGYTQINLTGYEFFSCSKSDAFHSGFTAVAPGTKNRVKGVVCCGWVKSCTVRFD